jgi:hypothetical protein
MDAMGRAGLEPGNNHVSVMGMLNVYLILLHVLSPADAPRALESLDSARNLCCTRLELGMCSL